MVKNNDQKSHINVRLETLYYLIGKKDATSEDVLHLVNASSLSQFKKNVPQYLINYCNRENKKRKQLAKERWELRQLYKTPPKKREAEEIKKKKRKSSPKVSLLNPAHIYALIKRAEYDYMNLKPEVPFSPAEFEDWIKSKQWKCSFYNMGYFYYDLPQIVKKFGVKLVLLPYVSGSVYGFLTWSQEHPIICVTDKFHDHIACWITFLHLAFHSVNKKSEGIMYLEPNLLTLEDNIEGDFSIDCAVSNLLFKGIDLQLSLKNYCSKEKSDRYYLAQEFDLDIRLVDYMLRKYREDYTNYKVPSLIFKDLIHKFIYTKKVSMEENEIIQNNIHFLLKKKKINQATLSKYLGLSKGHVSNLMSGKREWNRVTLLALSSYLKIKIEDLKDPNLQSRLGIN